MKIPRITIKFDVEKNLYNVWETCNDNNAYGHDFSKTMPKQIVKLCKNKKFEDCKKELKCRMLSVHSHPLIEPIRKFLDFSWSKISKEYFQRLEKIIGKQFYSKEVIIYLTTAQRCPYRPNENPPYFYVNFFNGIQDMLLTIGHELMHLQFHNMEYWDKIEKELDYKKTHDLKEALTVLLNIEFRDLWIVDDRGYPNHKQLRKFIRGQWKNKKDFGLLLDKSIKWIKKNGIK